MRLDHLLSKETVQNSKNEFLRNEFLFLILFNFEGLRIFKSDNSMWGFSSAGRAPALHAGGQRFDPARLHQITEEYPSPAEGIGLENRQAG